MTLTKKTDLHILRKLWHIGTGFVFAVMYQNFLTRQEMILFFTVCLVLSVLLEWSRFKFPKINRLVVILTKPIMRQNELKELSGTVFYLAGGLLAVLVFPKWVAILSLIFLALGDPIASFMGTQLGDLSKRYKNGKSWIGSLGSAFACFFFSMIYLGVLPIEPSSVLILSLGGAIGAAFAEAISSEGIFNDNLLIPVISGGWLYGASVVLGVSVF